QDQASASAWGMGAAALSTGCVDGIVPLPELAHTLVSLHRTDDSSPTVSIALRYRNLAVESALRQTLDALLDSTIDLCHNELGNVQLLDHHRSALKIVVQRGFDSAFLDHFAGVRRDHGSACARAMRLRAPVLIEDVTEDHLFAPHRAFAKQAGFRSVQS